MLQEVAVKMENIRAKHPQLLYVFWRMENIFHMNSLSYFCRYESKVCKLLKAHGIPEVKWFGTVNDYNG